MSHRALAFIDRSWPSEVEEEAGKEPCLSLVLQMPDGQWLRVEWTAHEWSQLLAKPHRGSECGVALLASRTEAA